MKTPARLGRYCRLVMISAGVMDGASLLAQPADGPSASARGGNPDAGIVFTRPTSSPGLGQPMELPQPDADGFSAMFNGKDLSGWDALPNFWSVRDGAIDCVQTAEKGGNVQSDLSWMDSQQHPEKYANYEFRVKFRWISQSGNSGVQFRSVQTRAETKHIGGYQADFDPRNAYTGAIYDEGTKTGRRQREQRALHMAPRGFKTTYPADGGIGKSEPLEHDSQTLATMVKPLGGEFNELAIVADGPHITIRINGHVFSELIDENPGAMKSGIIAFQQHAGGQMAIQFKEPKIKLLPAKPQGPQAAGTTNPAPPVRTFVKNWTVDELVPLVNKGLKGKRDFERGQKVFTEASCSVCHLFVREGGGVGPDLTGSGTFSVRDLLESIIEPSKQISSLYGTTAVKKKDGGVVAGRVPEESDTAVSVMEDMLDPGKLTVIKREDIETMTPSTLSLMPPGLLDTLKEDEISDLIAFLLSGGDSTLRMFQ